MDKKILMNEIDKLKPFPKVILKVLDVVNRPDWDVDEVVNIVQYDPIITANCLRICNSVYYGLKMKVTDIGQAITMLGSDTLIKLIVSSCGSQLGFSEDQESLWLHNVSVALASQIIFRRCINNPALNLGIERSDQFKVYTASLLHDIGKVIIDKHIRTKYRMVNNLMMRGLCNSEDIEKELFGIDHTEIGKLIADRWDFPEDLTIPIKEHHAPIIKEDGVTVKTIVNVSNLLVQTITICFHDKIVCSINPRVLDIFGFVVKDMRNLKSELLSELSKAEEIIKISKGS